jgi:hypothetical protein
LKQTEIASKIAEEKRLLEDLYAVEKDPSANPELSEFLDAMRPQANRRTWMNDAAVGGGGKACVRTPRVPRSPCSPLAIAILAVTHFSPLFRFPADGVQQKSGKVKASLQSVPAKRPGGEGVSYIRAHLKFAVRSRWREGSLGSLFTLFTRSHPG